MSTPDELVDLAASISDGAVGWPEVERNDAFDDDALLRELHAIARIAGVHRSSNPDPFSASRETRWGRLVVVEPLGAGAFGTVYRAWDPDLERAVALKIYRDRRDPSGELDDPILTEGRLLARVRHPNVAVVHGIERRGNDIGLWMELIDGWTLAAELRDQGPIGVREAALIGQDLCRALAAVHKAGLIHRDVKSQNVMRERGGRIVLMDFGVGIDRANASSRPDRPQGTPLYMAPELFDGSAATPQSDVYSLGVLLFHLVTGTYPVPAQTRAELERSHHDGRRQLLRDVRPDIPAAFISVIDRAAAPNPAERYQTAGAFEAALSPVLGTGDLSSGTTARVPRRRAMSSAAVWVAAIAALIVIAIAIGSWPRTLSRSRVDANPVDRTVTSATLANDYQIEASFFRVDARGATRLAPDERVSPGDRLYLELEASHPVHVYVVNQDERGKSYLLFPLPGQTLTNPVAAGQRHRLPGARGGADLYWQVTSAGGREHFLIVASPDPLPPLEAAFAALPPAMPDRPVMAAPLTSSVVGQLRGVGGLVGPAQREASGGPAWAATTLSAGRESVSGPWMRQFTLTNPGK